MLSSDLAVVDVCSRLRDNWIRKARHLILNKRVNEVWIVFFNPVIKVIYLLYPLTMLPVRHCRLMFILIAKQNDAEVYFTSKFDHYWFRIQSGKYSVMVAYFSYTRWKSEHI